VGGHVSRTRLDPRHPTGTPVENAPWRDLPRLLVTSYNYYMTFGFGSGGGTGGVYEYVNGNGTIRNP
jgi:hypothetical protein